VNSPEKKCKPGGCSSIGCEGGHYCFNADGTQKVVSAEKKAELEAFFKEIAQQRLANRSKEQ
jgi:hypothetical protein